MNKKFISLFCKFQLILWSVISSFIVPDISWASFTNWVLNELDFQLFTITYEKQIFVGAGASGLGVTMTSPDGVEWQVGSPGTTERIDALASDGRIFVAAGGSGTILTSSDGITWTNRTSGTSRALTGACYGNGLFVIVGQNGTILTSPNGSTWATQRSGVNYQLQDVVFGNGKFIVAVNADWVLTSVDGTNWFIQKTVEYVSLRDIVFGDGIFVGVGADSSNGNQVTFLMSSNGINWTAYAAPAVNGLGALAYGAGTFVAVGAVGTIVTSEDAMNWTVQNSPTSRNLFDVAYGNGTFVAVGTDGTIVTSTGTHISRPVANAGTDRAVFDQVTLNGSGSYDLDGNIVSYEWLLEHREIAAYDRIAEGLNPTISDLAPGFYDVILTVTDNGGLIDTDTMLLAVAGQGTGWPSPNANLEVSSFRITKNKRSGNTTTQMSGNIDLPALGLVNGDTVRSRITIEVFDALAGGGDLIMSEEATLTVRERPKTLDIRK